MQGLPRLMDPHLCALSLQFWGVAIVPDLKLDQLVVQLLAKIDRFDETNSFGSNIVDPFAAALEAAIFRHITEDSWRQSELHRQKQKALMNYVGQMHQEIIGCLPGWTSFSAGSNSPDVVGVRGSQRIIAEIKNKHNTMNARSAAETYDTMVDFLARDEYQGYIGIVVQVIGPRLSGGHWKNFAPGRNRPARPDIIVMNGRPFYSIAVDRLNRQPNIDVRATDDLQNWDTWLAIDEMIEQLFVSIGRLTGSEIPEWVNSLIVPALGN